MNTLNWGIIGTGGIAEDFAAGFQDTGITCHGVSSRSLEKAEAFREAFGLNAAYGDYQELLQDEAIDIVYIATPHHTHAQIAADALQAGKHTVVEKPIVTQADDLAQLKQLAEAQGVYLFEAMTIHYRPVYQTIRELIDQKDLGALKMIQVNFGSFKPKDTGYFFQKDLAGGALLDIGVYALNFVMEFLSTPPTEMKTIGYINEEFGVDESAGIVLKNDQNELATITMTFHAKLPKRGVIAFEGGYFEIDNYPRADHVTFTTPEGKTEHYQAGQSSQALQEEMIAITNLIASGTPQPHLTKTTHVIELMDAIRQEWNLTYPFDNHTLDAPNREKA